MAGYGVYSGVSGLPYTVGGNQGFVQTDGVSSPSQEQGGVMAQRGDDSAVGAQAYQSMMPQWMQDYFDTNLVGQGYGQGDLLTKQRELAFNRMDELKRQYGEKQAINPYFTQTQAKGFDPFKNKVYTTNSTRGRFQEFQPWFVYDRTETQTRNPFSGNVEKTRYDYNMAPGPQDPGSGGSWGDAAKYGMYGSVMGPVGMGAGAYMGITGKKPW